MLRCTPAVSAASVTLPVFRSAAKNTLRHGGTRFFAPETALLMTPLYVHGLARSRLLPDGGHVLTDEAAVALLDLDADGDAAKLSRLAHGSFLGDYIRELRTVVHGGAQPWRLTQSYFLTSRNLASGMCPRLVA